MIFLADLGNTRLKLAYWKNETLHALGALNHADPTFLSQLRQRLADIRHSDQDLTQCSEVWLSAVTPEAARITVQQVFEAEGVRVRRVQTQPRALGLQVGYAHHEQLGVDRWLALLAAHAENLAPCVIASVGTALTCDALAPQGHHLGGVIAPAPDTMRSALLARAPHLDGSPGRMSFPARSTQDGIYSGCMLAGVALIERVHAWMSEQSTMPVRLILSGGGASALRPHLMVHEYRPDLVLEGLARWTMANR